MNRVIKIVVALIWCQQSYAQLINDPVFYFERLSWHQSLEEVSSGLRERSASLVEVPRSSLFKLKSDAIMKSYPDTMYCERIGVGLQFSQRDSLLESVIVSYLGIDSTTHKQYPDVDDRLARLWRAYSDHLGGAPSEKSIPFAGRIREWSFDRTTIQLYSMTSVSSLMISFTPKE